MIGKLPRLWDKLHILLSRLICGNGSLVPSLPQTARQLSFDACVTCSPGSATGLSGSLWLGSTW
uniref:Uncharacterized protein n=1 Tax=Timema genevievae TaxID=629358 RepID=A0A7R9JZ70_TIMGE|nr:unnamed protein product [Timema genevievae]